MGVVSARTVVGPTDHQVLPRGRDDRATAVWYVESSGDVTAEATLRGSGGALSPQVQRVDAGRVRVSLTLSVGGPYDVTIRALRSEGEAVLHIVDGLLVGDVWALAGQSNMQGVGEGAANLVALERCSMLGLDNVWRPALEPLHRIWQCEDNTQVRLWHIPNSSLTREQVVASYPSMHEQDARSPVGGVGPGYFFADALHAMTDVPVGLLPCAMGGSGMSLWSKEWARQHAADDPSGSLYGNLIDRARRAGPLLGILWYEGESEAMSGLGAEYPELFARFVDDVRTDLADESLPFLTVQLGTFDVTDPHFEQIAERMPGEWDLVREAQRALADRLPNVSVAVAADLPRTDLIHLSTEAHRVLGRRLALHAADLVQGKGLRGGPMLGDVTLSSSRDSIAVRLHNVIGPLQVDDTGFAFALDGDSALVVAASAVEPDLVVLHLDRPVAGSSSLFYGRGPEPRLGVVDALGQPLPCFGPVPVW